MNEVWVVPPLIVAVALFLWLGSKANAGLELRTNRIARVFFDWAVSETEERRHRIEAAYIETTYRTYAAKTVLYAFLGLFAGAIAGAYIVAGTLFVIEPVVRTLSGLPRTITRPIGITPDFTLELAAGTRWLVLIAGGILGGIGTAVLAYVMRWQLPASDAEVRRRSIQEGLPRTTAFMYALSRGGMEFPQVLRTLAENRSVYGEVANEMSITVREMDLFGRDMITALQRMSERTPSEQFNTFSENLMSVLQSGSELSTFFSEQYERFRNEAEQRQQSVLELLGTIAEGYVTVLVAGMLFLITILLVFGLTTADTLWILRLIIYLIMPLANAAFAIFLAQKLEALGIARRSGGEVLEQMEASTPIRSFPEAETTIPDGGTAHRRERENNQTLDVYDRVRRLRAILRSPVEVFFWNPIKILWITVPIALILFLVRVPEVFAAEGINVRILDTLLVQSVLLVLGTYAIIRELYKRRIDRIEAATPELLERLASLNEAGMSVVEGFDRVRGSDLGVLTPEVDRIWRDIRYGANIDDALIRFGRRVRTTAITRVVTLLANAMRASGEMGPVLRIAGEQARSEVNLRKQRRQEMLTYLLVIYISFVVFLVIIVAVNEVLVPSLPDGVPTPNEGQVNRLGVNADQFTRFAEVDKAAHTLVFFHAALIQAVCAGFIAGQLGEGSLRDGAKHAAIMLSVASLFFFLLSSPVASLNVTGSTSTGNTVIIQEASLSEGGYVAVYDQEGLEGELLGQTQYLAPGTHETVEIPIEGGEITEDRSVRIVPHRDTNGNEQFEFETPYLPGTEQVDRPYGTVSDGGNPGVEVELEYIG